MRLPEGKFVLYTHSKVVHSPSQPEAVPGQNIFVHAGDGMHVHGEIFNVPLGKKTQQRYVRLAASGARIDAEGSDSTSSMRAFMEKHAHRNCVPRYTAVRVAFRYAGNLQLTYHSCSQPTELTGMTVREARDMHKLQGYVPPLLGARWCDR
jgi:hypothetical protein